MKKIFVAGTLLIALTAVAAADEIKVEGGGTSITTVFLPIKDEFQKQSGYTLKIVQSSSIKGLIALSNGTIDIATGAHPLEDLIAGAAKEGVIIDKSTLVATAIEENELVVVSNRENPVRQLSKQQLKQIFTGKITNWREVGGADVAIEVVWGKETRGQNIQFTRVALDGEPITSRAQDVTNYSDVRQRVTTMPGAIGVIPVNMSSSMTRRIETMTFKSPIYIITKGVPSKKVQQLMDFYKTEWANAF